MLFSFKKLFKNNFFKKIGKILLLVLPIGFCVSSLSSCASVSTNKTTSIEISDVDCTVKSDLVTDIKFYITISNSTIYCINDTDLVINCFKEGTLDGTHKIKCGFSIAPNTSEKHEIAFTYPNQISDVTLDSYLFEWLGVWSSYATWWITILSVFCTLIIIFQFLLWFGLLDGAIRTFESYWWAFILGLLWFFIFFGIIIPYFLFGPWTWVSILIPFGFFVFTNIFNSIIVYIYAKTKMKRRKHEKTK